jgi:hypothetical protein
VTQASAWRRGFIEAAFVLSSILLAFWIDAWWDDRQAEQLEAEMLLAVQVEVEQNLRELAITKRTVATYQDGVDQFLRSTPADLRALPQNEIRRRLVFLSVPQSFNPSLSATSVLVTIPVSQAPESAEARRLVSEWLGWLENVERRSATVSSLTVELHGQLARYAGRGALDGLERLDPMVARLSPDVLAELREDDDFVSTVIEMAHYREVYVTGLDRVGGTLDSLSVVLGAR